MQIIAMILSGFAFLTAIVSLILTVQEKKRGKKRNAAACQYADETVKYHISMLELRIADSVDAAKQELSALLSNQAEKINKLEQGITPDYEQAKAAASAVNDFNRGITNILNFDPMEALRKERSREGE